MKKKKCLALLLVLLAIVVFPLSRQAVRADFGDFAGDTDYGGSDFDFGGSDSDYDYGDYDGSSGGGSLLYSAIILAVILIVGAVSKKRKPGGARPAGAQATNPATLKPLSEYVKIDPAFDQNAFCEKLSNLYVQMQNGWTAKDIESLRPYFTDALFTQMERQLDQMRKAGRTNYVERIAVLGVTPSGFRQGGGEDHIIVQLRTRIVDYTLEDSTGNLISGNKTAEKFMTYEWDLVRETGVQTAAADGTEKITCPSCGAPLDINASARCPYCGSVIQQKAKDWAICAIKGLSQTTR